MTDEEEPKHAEEFELLFRVHSAFAGLPA